MPDQHASNVIALCPAADDRPTPARGRVHWPGERDHRRDRTHSESDPDRSPHPAAASRCATRSARVCAACRAKRVRFLDPGQACCLRRGGQRLAIW